MLTRILALSLNLGLALPHPSYALREIQTVDSGVEEQELAGVLRGSLLGATTAGMEGKGRMEERRMPGEGRQAHDDPAVLEEVVRRFSVGPFSRLEEPAQELLREFLSGGRLGMVLAVRKMAEFGKMDQHEANGLLTRAWISAQGGKLSGDTIRGLVEWYELHRKIKFEEPAAFEEWFKDSFEKEEYLTIAQGQELYTRLKELIAIAWIEPADNRLMTTLQNFQELIEKRDWNGLCNAIRISKDEDRHAILSIFIAHPAARPAEDALRNYISLLWLVDFTWGKVSSEESIQLLFLPNLPWEDFLRTVHENQLAVDEKLEEMRKRVRSIPLSMIKILREPGPEMTLEQEAAAWNLAAVGAHLMRKMAEDPSALPEAETVLDYERDRAYQHVRGYHNAYLIRREDPKPPIWMRELLLEYFRATGMEENVALVRKSATLHDKVAVLFEPGLLGVSAEDLDARVDLMGMEGNLHRAFRWSDQTQLRLDLLTSAGVEEYAAQGFHVIQVVRDPASDPSTAALLRQAIPGVVVQALVHDAKTPEGVFLVNVDLFNAEVSGVTFQEVLSGLEADFSA